MSTNFNDGAQQHDFQYELQENPVEMNQIVFAALKSGLAILGRRALMILAMFGCLGLFSYAAFEPEPMRILVAVAFAVIVFLPLLIASSKDSKQ